MSKTTTLTLPVPAVTPPTIQPPAITPAPIPTFLRLLAILLLAAPLLSQGLPAFAGAQGGGATSRGGRSGVVYVVNDLSDSTHSSCAPWGVGTCSLRDCVQASGIRNCVGGSQGGIVKTCSLQVHNGNLTIAGQTFPGGGLTLMPSCGGPNGLLAVMTNDVVIRYITASPGPGSTPGPDSGINCFLEYAGSVRVIWDHVTCRWSDDKPWLANNNGPQGINQITLQWSLFYRPNVGHPVGVSGGTISGDAKQMNDIDIHHTANFESGHRLPLEYYTSQRYVNNLIWNWGGYSVAFAGGFQGGMKADIIGNKYVAGNINSSISAAWALPFQFQQPVSDDVNAPPQNDLTWTGNQYYLTGNIGPQMTNPAGDQTKLTSFNTGDMESGHPDPTSPAPANAFRAAPLPTLPFPITADPVSNLDTVLLATVGNSQGIDCSGNWQGRRDSKDAEIVAAYQSNAQGWFYADSGHPLDQQPTIAATSAALPACKLDIDGIPIPYKTANGLTVGKNVASAIAANGETVLNNYFAGSGSSVPPIVPPVNPPTSNWTAGQAVIINAHGTASSSNAWTSLNPPIGAVPFALGDKATVVSGAIVTQNTWPYMQVTFTSGASSGKAGYVGADWIDAVGVTPPPANPTITAISIACAPITVVAGGQSICTATVTGTGNFDNMVTWSANLGTITKAGIYTATPAASNDTVSATSNGDSTKVARQAITVTAPTPPPTQTVTCIIVNNMLSCPLPH